MKQIYRYLNELKASYQQEHPPYQLPYGFYLTPEQRLEILKDILAPYSEEEEKLSKQKLSEENK
ncbi:hypothetical protein [Hafnia alvei]|uniref:Uncharacterized protein n=1 Tax=Hafnia alvei TaxID=569 RepID=A0A1C6Z6T7_HAFAL|nr:hypothetical protein [Hafnia alvei]NLS54874.1 hypothetical protein [Hafnia alvei]SCM54902.1 hypothetical protein BN1044_04413 [Hafnia alvei]